MDDVDPTKLLVRYFAALGEQGEMPYWLIPDPPKPEKKDLPFRGEISEHIAIQGAERNVGGWERPPD